MHFKCGGVVNFEAFVDASWATHDDGHGRTSIAMMMANCVIAAWSTKQKMVTRSFPESEIVALSDGLTQVMWIRNILRAQGYELPPTVIYQDNMSIMSVLRHADTGCVCVCMCTVLCIQSGS